MRCQGSLLICSGLEFLDPSDRLFLLLSAELSQRAVLDLKLICDGVKDDILGNLEASDVPDIFFGRK